jgi:hypothetical protein
VSINAHHKQDLRSHMCLVQVAVCLLVAHIMQYTTLLNDMQCTTLLNDMQCTTLQNDSTHVLHSHCKSLGKTLALSIPTNALHNQGGPTKLALYESIMICPWWEGLR